MLFYFTVYYWNAYLTFITCGILMKPLRTKMFTCGKLSYENRKPVRKCTNGLNW